MRLGYLVTHPIQYQAPLLKRVANMKNVDFKVYYQGDIGVREKYDPNLKIKFSWDIPLLDGCDYEFIPSLGSNSNIGTIWPFAYDMGKRLKRDGVDVLWIHSYASLNSCY